MRIDSIEIILENNGVELSKQVTSKPYGPLGLLFSRRTFSLAQMWLQQDEDVNVKEFNSTTKMFMIPKGTSMFASLTVKVEPEVLISSLYRSVRLHIIHVFNYDLLGVLESTSRCSKCIQGYTILVYTCRQKLHKTCVCYQGRFGKISSIVSF